MKKLNVIKETASKVIKWYSNEYENDFDNTKYAVFEDKKGQVQVACISFKKHERSSTNTLEIKTYIDENKVTSYSSLRILGDNMAYLKSIATFFDYRNTGISSKVLELAQMIFAENNIKDIVGTFYPNNPFYDEFNKKTQNSITLKKQAEIFYKKHKFLILSQKDLKKQPKELAQKVQFIFEEPENFGHNVIYKNIEKQKFNGFEEKDGVLFDKALLEYSSGEFGS